MAKENKWNLRGGTEDTKKSKIWGATGENENKRGEKMAQEEL